jgi:glycosyltransferase involved in cell wall biosynthesis
LHDAVQSIVDQTFSDWELVAVLDGCTDGSEGVIEGFQDSRIKLFRMTAPGGFPYTLNFGLKQCRGELVARMDQDDISLPSRLERQIAVFDSRPALAVLGTSAQIVDESSRVVGYRRVVTGVRRVGLTLLWRNQLIHPAVMFRRSLILELGGYDPASSPIFEDYDLWLRAVGLGEVDNLEDSLLKYRRHPAAPGSSRSR